MSETERVVQLWPRELKEQVKEVAGKRGLTEVTIKAVKIHLGVDADLTAVEKELNEVKFFAQQMADQVVLGIESPEQRLQALMELEFPSWIDTSGWPKSFADRVRPDVPEQVQVNVSNHDLSQRTGNPQVNESSVAQEVMIPPPELVDPIITNITSIPLPEEAESPKAKVLLEVAAGEKGRPSKDDLFARVMAKTGGNLTDISGLKLASEIPVPPEREETEVVTPEGVCPTCGEAKVDGECWTCD